MHVDEIQLYGNEHPMIERLWSKGGRAQRVCTKTHDDLTAEQGPLSVGGAWKDAAQGLVKAWFDAYCMLR